MEYILKNYTKAYEEPFSGNPLGNFIRNELPDRFRRAIPDSGKYYIKGSPGIGSWAKVPWIGFLNKDISSMFNKEGYYVAYLFKEDMSGFYLSLMFSVGNFRQFSGEELTKVSDDLRKFILAEFPQIRRCSPVKLRKMDSNSHMAKSYEKADIYSIEYQINDLPSEYELKRDLRFLLEIYDFIHENNLIELAIQKNSDKSSLHVLSNGYSKDLNGENPSDLASTEDDIQLILDDKIEKILDKLDKINHTNSETEKRINDWINFHSEPIHDLKITIEDSTTFYRPVLELFRDGKNHHSSEIVEGIRNILPNDEKDSNKVENRVQHPIKHFYEAGCLERIDLGLHCITRDGVRLLETDIVSLDQEILKKYCPKYRQKYGAGYTPYDNNRFVSDIDKFRNIITIEDSTTFYRPVLELFRDGKNHRNSEIVEGIRNILPNDEKDSDKVGTWVSFPIKHFYDAGCLKRIDRGLHCITEDGVRLLETDIVSLDRKVLKKYCPKYRKKYVDNKIDGKSQFASNMDKFRNIITIEDSTTFYRPVLELFSDGNIHSNSEIVEGIRNILPNDEKDSDKVGTWVSFPIKHFYDAGCLKRIDRGLHRITRDGIRLLETDNISLDRKVLTKYCPKYREKYFTSNKIDDESRSGRNHDNFGINIAAENGSLDKKLGSDDKHVNKIKISEIVSNPNKYYNIKKHSNKFKDLLELLSSQNINKLEEVYFLEEKEFEDIIENIINVHQKVLDRLIENNGIDFEKLNILEKMFLFSKAFVKTHYKYSCDNLGHYEFNEIYIEEREPTDYKKIRTIIHELSHFLLSEILEQVVSLILDTDKTDILEAFIFYTLTEINDFYLIDEYCACTVEGRFVSRGHQDYTSFKNSSVELKHTFTDDVIYIYGNTFAKYIIIIMESFLNEDLINEIRKEGSEVDYPHNDNNMEIDQYLEWDDFSDTLGLILNRKTDHNKEETVKLFEYYEKIKENNK